MMKQIFKVALVTTDKDNRLLVVRWRGSNLFTLPGGKPLDNDEIDINCLGRELTEELGVTLVGNVEYLGSFGATAADMKDVLVTVRAYQGRIVGGPTPQAEIEEFHWLDIHNPDVPIAESIKTGIIPVMKSRGISS